MKILEIQDITEEVNAERRRDDFLATLAHELRNPLAPISSTAELLKLVGDTNERIHSCGDVIARQVSHLNVLIDDLLDVSRVKRGLIELNKEDLDLKAIIASTIEQAVPLIDAHNHRLSTHIASGSAIVQGDKTRLVQIIVNLINNSAKYTPSGGQIIVALDIQSG